MYPEELVGTELFKVFNRTQKHNGFQYQEGIVNRLIEPFAKTGSCVKGGFYFTTKEHISKFLDYGNQIRRVHVSFDHPDLEVVKDPEGNKYRTNMLMLGEKCTVEELFSMLPLKNLFIWANDYNQLDVFDHWNDMGSPKMSEVPTVIASSRGLVDVLEWRKKNGELVCIDLNGASQNGHVSVLEWWKNNSEVECILSSRAMDGASQNGHVSVLEWWKNSGLKCKWSTWAMYDASRNGHVDVLEWWKNTELQSKIAATRSPKANLLKCKWSGWVMDVASTNGHVSVLEWWKKNMALQPSANELWSECAMDDASEKGHIKVLEWWKNSGLKLKWTSCAMDWCSAKNRVDVLEWWKNSGLECKWSEYAMNAASCNGHIRVLEWWKNSGLECR